MEPMERWDLPDLTDHEVDLDQKDSRESQESVDQLVNADLEAVVSESTETRKVPDQRLLE